MFFAFIYLLLRRLVQLLAGSSNLNSDVEVVVLRHQLRVLRRQVGRPRLRRRDRLFMAAISRTLPRARWSSFVVSPNTLLRWHPGAGAKEVDLSKKGCRRQAADAR
jgi:putative transposase